MANQFQNQNPAPLFGEYTDPYAHRRGTGPTLPQKTVELRSSTLRQAFSPDKLYFSWLGHSSVFLCMHGKTMLIDPVFSMRTSPIPFLGPKRFPGPVPTPDMLPEIDYLLITHSHYDHLDKATIRALDPQVRQYIAPTGVGAILHRFGIRTEKITELGWFEDYQQDGLTISCTPTQHGSARSPFDRNRTLWCSYVLRDAFCTVFDTGDGGFGGHFAQIHQRYGDADLAIMECGQYNVRWHGLHMFPEESVEAARILGAGLAIPVHWGAYILSDHPWDDPPKRFRQRAEELGLPFRIPQLAELLEIPVKGQNQQHTH